ncbi:MAG: excinuclease subunit [Thermoproteota archaeon]|nr:excinuclease subunit [Thermoproteota archaeon]
MISIYVPSDFRSSEIPATPGVYLFKDEMDELLYIGKAKSLRERVKNYFSKSDKPLKTQLLVSQIRHIEWIIVDSEVEALLLENKLIKQYLPKYNISLKDAKTFAYIAFTKEEYPRIITSRKLSTKLESFGPYTDGFMRQDLTRLVVKVFKLRVCKTLPKRACLNYHMGTCSAPCIGKVGKEYREQIEQARHFLKGEYVHTIEQLNSQMEAASGEQKYERALELRNQISSIQLLTQHQVVDTEKRFDQDVMAFRRLGEKVLVVQMSVRRGVLLGKREFSVDLQPNVEQEFLKVFYTANKIPREILLNKRMWLDGEEKAALEEFFSTKRQAPVALTVPTRSDKLSLVRLAEKNIEANLEEDSVLVDIQTALNLPTLPHTIECFDISNLGEEHIVSGMVRYKDGKPDKNNYRRFRIKTVVEQDDFASINEVVKRRYRRLLNERTQMPDLIVVDGGSGQINAADAALHSLGLQIPLIGLAKKFEEIYLPGETTPRRFDRNSRMMLILEQIRDAAHNFSLNYNLKRRQMKMRMEFNPRH